ncbi:MAG: hypothetical protein OZSIB_0051 [Candidatus Ozemobacter sibiricus]|uniref:Uncharacterized protein n=1 Tax=Candidatus Ozemobacter sibiricus TaxID=2268124 RepID=A0A367ZPX8_9BACT|nr:MAG: hypothetical protein OZSIB_0051 [Candidatus Ozemobacter sibiricus]
MTSWGPCGGAAAVSEYVPFGPDGGPYHQRRLAYLQGLAEAGRAPAP